MIDLNDRQADALAELINVAFGLTAAKLSEISGQRVLLEPPTIVSHPIEGLAKDLDVFASGEVVSVHQVFSGPFSGDAILCLNSEGAVKLSNILIEEHLQSKQLDTTAVEILTEIGNMLLSACLGVFGNLLQMHISFSVPVLHQDSRQQFLNSLTIAGNENRHAVVINSSFKIRESGVAGRIAIVLSISSLERLIKAVDQWEGIQVSAN
jgi:chemotaxis protein CheC